MFQLYGISIQTMYLNEKTKGRKESLRQMNELCDNSSYAESTVVPISRLRTLIMRIVMFDDRKTTKTPPSEVGVPRNGT